MNAINMTELKTNVETLAKQEGLTELEAISLLQTGAAATENDELLDALCELKWDYIPMIEGEGAPQHTMFDLPANTQLSLL